MSLLGLDLRFASGGDCFLVSFFGDGCSLCFDWWFCLRFMVLDVVVVLGSSGRCWCLSDGCRGGVFFWFFCWKGDGG